jgi:hypothetical protein
MNIKRINSFSSYLNHRDAMRRVYEQRVIFERSLQEKHPHSFEVPGFSYPARQQVGFLADFTWSVGGNVNWRERLVCPITGLNNRQRAAIHLADSEIGINPHESIYITEQVTSLYTYLKNLYPSIVGSEYLATSAPKGGLDHRGIRNEDLSQLSFNEASLDAVLSFDCFEHMPNFTTPAAELYRVLKKGGRLMWSVPFRSDLQLNLRRASINNDGTINHHEPPEYHGDPINAGGCLCFTHFGWEMLDQVRRVGFQDAYAVLYWSDIFGYLGIEQFMFVAVK